MTSDDHKDLPLMIVHLDDLEWGGRNTVSSRKMCNLFEVLGLSPREKVAPCEDMT